MPLAVKKRYICVFRHPLIHDQVNPRLGALNKNAPYGAFQRIWRQVHCPAINPYGSEDCPYRAEDCVIAYWKTATDALTQAKTSPIGLFRILATRRGYDRAENKPLARDRDEAGARGRGDPEGPRLRGSTSGPVRIGTLLGALDPRTRQRPEHERKEGPR